MQLDSLPYQKYKDLKTKFPVVTVVIRQKDFAMQGMHLAYKDHRAYVYHKFSQLGVEVYRFNHDYISLDTAHPKLGLVFMVNDSIIDPGMEVHALIGHNARYQEGTNGTPKE